MESDLYDLPSQRGRDRMRDALSRLAKGSSTSIGPRINGSSVRADGSLDMRRPTPDGGAAAVQTAEST